MVGCHFFSSRYDTLHRLHIEDASAVSPVTFSTLPLVLPHPIGCPHPDWRGGLSWSAAAPSIHTYRPAYRTRNRREKTRKTDGKDTDWSLSPSHTCSGSRPTSNLQATGSATCTIVPAGRATCTMVSGNPGTAVTITTLAAFSWEAKHRGTAAG